MACEKGSVVLAQSVVVFGVDFVDKDRTECCPFFGRRFGSILPFHEGQNAAQFSPMNSP